MASRVSQVVVESVVLPTSQKARVSQVVVEAIIQLANQKVRVSQIVVEVVMLNATSRRVQSVQQCGG